MGASGWMYLVQYQEDIQTALNTLRKEVFTKGDYHTRQSFNDDFASLEDILPANASPEDRKAILEQYASWKQEVQPVSFNSIDELRIWNGEEGTHSILDIHTVEREPLEHANVWELENALQRRITIEELISITRSRIGRLYPLSKKHLQLLFGTTKPHKELVMNQVHQLYDLRDRGIGTYIIIYKDNIPEEILFIGFSGD